MLHNSTQEILICRALTRLSEDCHHSAIVARATPLAPAADVIVMLTYSMACKVAMTLEDNGGLLTSTIPAGAVYNMRPGPIDDYLKSLEIGSIDVERYAIFFPKDGSVSHRGADG